MFAAIARMTVTASVVCVLSLPPSLQAATCKPEIRRNNIIANALFTTLFRSINGELNSWSDLGESLTYGAGAGYLFYKSRVMIGEGDENLGLATAFIASSITENTTLGEHPLAYLRWGLGPVDFRWKTNFAQSAVSKQSFFDSNRLSIGINAIDTIGLVAIAASGKADDFRFRNGVITGSDRGLIDEPYDGVTIGRTIVMDEKGQRDDKLWRHELIHTTQYLQFSSFGSLGFNPFNFDRFDSRNSRSGVGMHVRIEWFNSLINQLDEARDYEDRWMEIEAARLAQNRSPLGDANDVSCSSQVGFQFQF